MVKFADMDHWDEHRVYLLELRAFRVEYFMLLVYLWNTNYATQKTHSFHTCQIAAKPGHMRLLSLRRAGNKKPGYWCKITISRECGFCISDVSCSSGIELDITKTEFIDFSIFPIRIVSVGEGVLHNNDDDDTYMTPSGRFDLQSRSAWKHLLLSRYFLGEEFRSLLRPWRTTTKGAVPASRPCGHRCTCLSLRWGGCCQGTFFFCANVNRHEWKLLFCAPETGYDWRKRVKGQIRPGIPLPLRVSSVSSVESCSSRRREYLRIRNGFRFRLWTILFRSRDAL